MSKRRSRAKQGDHEAAGQQHAEGLLGVEDPDLTEEPEAEPEPAPEAAAAAPEPELILPAAEPEPETDWAALKDLEGKSVRDVLQAAAERDAAAARERQGLLDEIRRQKTLRHSTPPAPEPETPAAAARPLKANVEMDESGNFVQDVAPIAEEAARLASQRLMKDQAEQRHAMAAQSYASVRDSVRANDPVRAQRGEEGLQWAAQVVSSQGLLVAQTPAELHLGMERTRAWDEVYTHFPELKGHEKEVVDVLFGATPENAAAYFETFKPKAPAPAPAAAAAPVVPVTPPNGDAPRSPAERGTSAVDQETHEQELERLSKIDPMDMAPDERERFQVLMNTVAKAVGA